MKIYKVTVSKNDKQYLSVGPLIESKAKDWLNKLHDKYPRGVVTVLSTENPNDKWDEVWIINPSNHKVEAYIEEEEEYQDY